jgi:hypothetical protein
LERLFALVAAIVPDPLSLAIGRVVRGEDCPGGVVICLTKEGWVSVEAVSAAPGYEQLTLQSAAA